MNVRDRVRWEVQWHPASGASVHHLVLTWRNARRVQIALGFVGLVAVAGGLLAGIDALRTGRAVEAARLENGSLRAHHQALREDASALAGRMFADLDHGRRIAKSAHDPGNAPQVRGEGLPARDVGTEALLASLAEQSAKLEALGRELATGPGEVGGEQAPVPAPQ